VAEALLAPGCEELIFTDNLPTILHGECINMDRVEVGPEKIKRIHTNIRAFMSPLDTNV
jgi:hypothetical protein